MRVYAAILAYLILIPAAAFSCPITKKDFPPFELSEPTLPVFSGKHCSIDDWRSYHTDLSLFGKKINDYDEGRLDHDYSVRQFDRDLELAMARNECSDRQYRALTLLIRLANRSNSGSRKKVWGQLQAELRTAISSAKSNISALNVDLNAQCDGN